MSNNTIIIIEYQSGLVEWMPSNAETLNHIVDSFDSIKSVSEVRGGVVAGSTRLDELEQRIDKAVRALVGLD